MMAAGDTFTVPFCGSCGWNLGSSQYPNRDDDFLCDSCGADLLRFGFVAGLFPPNDLVATGGSLQVTFTWTAALDTQDLLYQIDSGAPVLVTGANAAGEIVVATAGQKVAGSIRTVLNGVEGPFSPAVADSATA